MKKNLGLLFFIAIIIAISYYVIPPLSLGHSEIVLKPVNLYLYVRLNYVDILSNTPITSKISKVELVLLVFNYDNGENIFNKTLASIDFINGHHEVNKEFLIKINNNPSQRYLLKIIDNYTKTPIVLGPPARYDTSLFTTYTSTYPCRVNISYAVVGKGIEIKTNMPLEAHIIIYNIHMERKEYVASIYNRGIIDTDYIVRKYFYGYSFSIIVKLYVDNNGRVEFRPIDNPLLLIIIETIILGSMYAYLVHHKPRKYWKNKRTR